MVLLTLLFSSVEESQMSDVSGTVIVDLCTASACVCMCVGARQRVDSCNCFCLCVNGDPTSAPLEKA